MSEDYIGKIDDTLNELLPDEPSDIGDDLAAQREKELIQLLQHAADELGKSPTAKEFDSLNLEITSDAIRHAFGGWNEAKRQAGLKTWQRGTTVPINERYFETIDTPAKAYWLGTLIAHSSLHKSNKGSGYSLTIGRTHSKSHFVRGFAEAIESEYPILSYSGGDNDPKGGAGQIQTQITNPTFVDNLLSAGYPNPNDEIGGFPTIQPEYRPHLVRGYLESSGYFSTGGWDINADSMKRAEDLHEWFLEFGAQRAPITEYAESGVRVRVANAFDIRAIFDTCWPDQLETDPSWKPYSEKIIEHLESNHPYPENVPYLST